MSTTNQAAFDALEVELLEHYSTHPTPTPLNTLALAQRILPTTGSSRAIYTFSGRPPVITGNTFVDYPLLGKNSRATVPKAISHFPHTCPWCSSPSYQGVTPGSKVDCSARCEKSLR